jgi:membrane protease YdiL (CAAX protease family)
MTLPSEDTTSASASPILRGRWVELAVMFAIAPLALATAPSWLVIPGILAGAGICLTLLLRDASFDRRRLWDALGARRGLGHMLVRTAVGCLALLVLVLWRRPEALFAFPRERTGLWVMVMIGYPLLSVYPQEIIFRTFFFHRYAALFRRPRALVIASALAFGGAHVVLHNVPAVVLSTLGGLLFAATYQRSRSTLLCAVEHAIYGCFVFSVGLGGLFYAGGRSLSSAFRL